MFFLPDEAVLFDEHAFKQAVHIFFKSNEV